MTNYDVYGVGNALVDTEYEVDDAFIQVAKLQKGVMTLIEAEERETLIHLLENEHEHQVIKQAGGGSAANTMVAIAQLGGKAFYSCKVASDATGDFFMADLQAAGVMTNLNSGREAGITGKCISMVTPDAERTMLTHLGITADLGVKELNPDALRQSKYLYIEGYLVTSPSALLAAKEAQAIARAAGVQVSLTLSDPAIVDFFKASFDELAEGGVDLVFCNEDEAKLWTAATTREDAMKRLKTICPRVAMTCGKDGAMVFDGDNVTLVPGFSAQAVDTTGAGDMFAGAFLYCINHGMSYVDAARIANKAAAQLVETFGARMPTAAVKALLQG
jgi:sugar/nucleoside kinase (ribokinase family)